MFKRNKKFAAIASGFMLHLVETGENSDVNEFTDNTDDLMNNVFPGLISSYKSCFGNSTSGKRKIIHSQQLHIPNAINGY